MEDNFLPMLPYGRDVIVDDLTDEFSNMEKMLECMMLALTCL